jgi:RimJ/RimL family protein N-acetyltransferase
MTTVDGQGAERAAVAIHRVVAGVPEETLILRSVTAADSRILWSWANDPEVRAASFTSDPIPWATHRAWFRSRLEDPTNRTYLAIGPFGEPLGQIRFDLRERNAELGISLAPEARGRGIGPQLLDLGVARLFRDTAVERVHAFVKPDNRASLGAFRKAGFRSLGAAVEQGHPCEHFLRERTDVSPGDPVS